MYDSDAANANARLSAQLPYIMATCRFAHYLKAMMRDRDWQLHFQRRTSDVLQPMDYPIRHRPTTSASQATKAKYPLREARVDVEEVKGKPGVYRAVAFLRPHFQLDELTVSLRLVASLPKPAGG